MAHWASILGVPAQYRSHLRCGDTAVGAPQALHLPHKTTHMATCLSSALTRPLAATNRRGNAAAAFQPAAGCPGRPQQQQRRQQQQQRWRRRAAGGDFDPLQPSKLFDSPFFMKEVEE